MKREGWIEYLRHFAVDLVVHTEKASRLLRSPVWGWDMTRRCFVVHVTYASRLNDWSSTRANKAVVVDGVTDLARKLQERKWLGREGLSDLLLSWSLVFLIFEEVHFWSEIGRSREHGSSNEILYRLIPVGQSRRYLPRAVAATAATAATIYRAEAEIEPDLALCPWGRAR